MRIGLLADIHEAAALLDVALRRLRAERVDRLVFLGDVFETGPQLDATVARLIEAGVEGVWGNHDFGFALDPDFDYFQRFEPSTRAFMGRLRPRLIVEDCHFSHVQPSLNLSDPIDLWHYQGAPSDWPDEERLACFAAVPQRLLLVGHFHRWSILTPEGAVPWDAREPFEFDPSGRYLIVVHAVCDGWCGVLDTAAGTLRPIALYETAEPLP